MQHSGLLASCRAATPASTVQVSPMRRIPPERTAVMAEGRRKLFSVMSSTRRPTPIVKESVSPTDAKGMTTR